MISYRSDRLRATSRASKTCAPADAFTHAAVTGDVDMLARVLADDAALYSDGDALTKLLSSEARNT